VPDVPAGAVGTLASPPRGKAAEAYSHLRHSCDGEAAPCGVPSSSLTRERLMNPERNVPDDSSDADGKPAAQPDADADRSAPQGASGARPPEPQPKSPLEIKEIEQLEDDAPGG
jgi:hypothetical protein